MDQNRLQHWTDTKSKYHHKIVHLAEMTNDNDDDGMHVEEALARILRYGNCDDASLGIKYYICYWHASNEIDDMLDYDKNQIT